MASISVRNFRVGMIGALPDAYPIEVVAGETVRVNRMTLDWQGPAMDLYICWGLKPKGGFFGVKFNNGENLVDHAWGWAMVSMPDSSYGLTSVDMSVQADLLITQNMPVATYDTWVWLTVYPDATEANQLVLDDDANIVRIIPAVIAAGELQVGYTKL